MHFSARSSSLLIFLDASDRRMRIRFMSSDSFSFYRCGFSPVGAKQLAEQRFYAGVILTVYQRLDSDKSSLRIGLAVFKRYVVRRGENMNDIQRCSRFTRLFSVVLRPGAQEKNVVGVHFIRYPVLPYLHTPGNAVQNVVHLHYPMRMHHSVRMSVLCCRANSFFCADIEKILHFLLLFSSCSAIVFVIGET